MARVFDAKVNGNILKFKINEDKIADIQTESVWSIEGVAISGELKNSRLDRLTYDPGFWFALVAFYPETELYK